MKTNPKRSSDAAAKNRDEARKIQGIPQVQAFTKLGKLILLFERAGTDFFTITWAQQVPDAKLINLMADRRDRCSVFQAPIRGSAEKLAVYRDQADASNDRAKPPGAQPTWRRKAVLNALADS